MTTTLKKEAEAPILPARTPRGEPEFLEAVGRLEGIVTQRSEAERQLAELEREMVDEPVRGPSAAVLDIVNGQEATETPAEPLRDRYRDLHKRCRDLEAAERILRDNIHGGPNATTDKPLMWELDLRCQQANAPERLGLIESIFGNLIELRDSLHAFEVFQNAYSAGGGEAEGIPMHLGAPSDANSLIHSWIEQVRRASTL